MCMGADVSVSKQASTRVPIKKTAVLMPKSLLLTNRRYPIMRKQALVDRACFHYPCILSTKLFSTHHASRPTNVKAKALVSPPITSVDSKNVFTSSNQTRFDFADRPSTTPLSSIKASSASKMLIPKPIPIYPSSVQSLLPPDQLLQWIQTQESLPLALSMLFSSVSNSSRPIQSENRLPSTLLLSRLFSTNATSGIASSPKQSSLWQVESKTQFDSLRQDSESPALACLKNELPSSFNSSPEINQAFCSKSSSGIDLSNHSNKSHLHPDNCLSEKDHGTLYSCVECGRNYSTSSNLARHRQTHRNQQDKRARKCDECGKRYVSLAAFAMHVRTHNQNCVCQHCGKSFSRLWLLKGHIRTHTGERPFKCTICSKAFADKSNLRAHVQTHSNNKPYYCQCCGKAFTLKSYLYKHEESSCFRLRRFHSSPRLIAGQGSYSIDSTTRNLSLPNLTQTSTISLCSTTLQPDLSTMKEQTNIPSINCQSDA